MVDLGLGDETSDHELAIADLLAVKVRGLAVHVRAGHKTSVTTAPTPKPRANVRVTCSKAIRLLLGTKRRGAR